MVKTNFIRMVKKAAVVFCAAAMCFVGGAVSAMAADEVESVEIEESDAEIATADSYIRFGQTINGTLSYSQSMYTYGFSLSSEGRVNIRFTSYDDSYVIRLYDSDGDQMKYVHTSYNGDLEFGKDTLIWDLVKGTYYITIEPWSSLSSGDYINYVMTPSFKSSGDNEGEPNDNYAMAKSISLPKVIKGQVALNDGNDFFKFRLSRTTDITIKFKSEDISNCDIDIYDSDGDKVEYWYLRRNDMDIINDVIKVTLPAGLYYLEVSSYYTGNYCFAISGGTTLTSKNVTLHSAVVTYTGKVRNSTVIVKDNYGKRLVKGKDYTVYVPSGRRNVGTYTYKIVFKGNYKGTVKKVFKIVPAATKLTKAVDTYSGVKLVWSRSSSASGYLIYRSTDGGSYKRIKGITSWRTGAYIDRSATSSWTTYSYKVYVYKKVNGKTYISPASASKSVYVY